MVQKSSNFETLPIHLDEAFRRFKFNVIEDSDALDGASVDRVREEFRAQIKSLRLCEVYYGGFKPPSRNQACFLPEEAAINMLADADCLPDDALEFYQSCYCKTITVVDGFWNREQQGSGETYRGAGQLALSGLVDFYVDLTTSVNAGAMENLHPIDG